MATFFNRECKMIGPAHRMELQSKKTGENYPVFSREEWVDRENTPPQANLRREQTSNYSLEVALGEIAAYIFRANFLNP